MARPRKLLELQTGNLTVEQRKQKELEESLVKVDSKNIKCPSWVKSKIAKNEFKRLNNILVDLDILTELEINSLANYCNCYAKFVQVSLELENEPLVMEYTNKSGFTNIIENPKLKVQLKLSKELRDLGNELGINMSSRLKFASSKSKELKDEIEDEFGDI